MAKNQQNWQQGKNPCCRFCFLREITIYLRNNQCRAYRSQTAPLSLGCTLRSFKLTGSVSNGKPSKVAVIPFRPSIPGPSRILTSSSSPALRKAALIVPPPTIAMRSTPNSVYRISTALCRSICVSPQTIHEICRESR